jgi:hypothetical protein
MQLIRRHVTFVPSPGHGRGADLKPVKDVVSEKVWKAMVDAHAALRDLGIRHVLVGGLAVGAYGWPRATRDVDFLVDDSAWTANESGLVVMRAGMPVQAHGVAIDTLSIREGEEHLREALETPERTEGIPVAPVNAVVYLKLTSPRSKDLQDVVELVRCGLRVEGMREYLTKNGPGLLERFEEAVQRAVADEDAE